jgi:hypothetical protein
MMTLRMNDNDGLAADYAVNGGGSGGCRDPFNRAEEAAGKYLTSHVALFARMRFARPRGHFAPRDKPRAIT